MPKVFLHILTISLTLTLLSSLSFAADKDDLEIAVLLQGMSNPYWKTLYDGVQDKAKKLGIETYIQGVQSDSDAEQQLNVCNTMLLRNPKALIFGAINNVNLAPCLRKASKMGIKLIDVDGGTSAADAKIMGIKLNFSVASDNYDLGKKAAEYLTGMKGKVLLIEGFPGSLPGKLRSEGFKENLSKGLTVVASLPGNWDRLRAADITNNIITKYPDLIAIFAANDLMALGAAESLLTRGKSEVKVIGVDGISDAVKAIRSGRLTASIAQLPYLIGGQALEKTYKLIGSHKKFKFNQKVPIVTLDKEILRENSDPLLKFVR